MHSEDADYREGLADRPTITSGLGWVMATLVHRSHRFTSISFPLIMASVNSTASDSRRYVMRSPATSPSCLASTKTKVATAGGHTAARGPHCCTVAQTWPPPESHQGVPNKKLIGGGGVG